MKFSLVNGQRHEAQPNLSGKCPVCDQPTVAKCGEVKIWHWAHKGRRTCDPWWENETDWHRAWKGEFPEDWQEVVHRADSGEKHIADVKTDQGWVIEFQHSFLTPEERRSRDAFYPKLVWVVDGSRRKRDAEQFRMAFLRGAPIGSNPHLRTVLSDECSILREWVSGNSLVFIDFGVGPTISVILRRSLNGRADVASFARCDFIEIYRDGTTQKAREFEELLNSLRNR
jgi:competence protein CoiA